MYSLPSRASTSNASSSFSTQFRYFFILFLALRIISQNNPRSHTLSSSLASSPHNQKINIAHCIGKFLSLAITLLPNTFPCNRKRSPHRASAWSGTNGRPREKAILWVLLEPSTLLHHCPPAHLQDPGWLV